MQNKKRNFARLFIVLSVLLIVTLACSLTSQSADETDSPINTPSGLQTEGNSQPATEIPLGEGTEIDDLNDVINSEALDSFRSTMTFTQKDASGNILDETSIYTEWNKADQAKYIKILDQSGEIIIEQLTIEDAMWIRNMMIGNSWLSVPATMASGQPQYPMQDFDLETVLQDDDTSIDYIGNDTVNGVKCRHYRMDTSQIFSIPDPMGGANISSTTKATGDIWIANESGMPKVMIRMVSDSETTSGTNPTEYSTVEIDITDINGNVTIEPPQ